MASRSDVRRSGEQAAGTNSFSRREMFSALRGGNDQSTAKPERRTTVVVRTDEVVSRRSVTLALMSEVQAHGRLDSSDVVIYQKRLGELEASSTRARNVLERVKEKGAELLHAAGRRLKNELMPWKNEANAYATDKVDVAIHMGQRALGVTGLGVAGWVTHEIYKTGVMETVARDILESYPVATPATLVGTGLATWALARRESITNKAASYYVVASELVKRIGKSNYFPDASAREQTYSYVKWKIAYDYAVQAREGRTYLEDLRRSLPKDSFPGIEVSRVYPADTAVRTTSTTGFFRDMTKYVAERRAYIKELQAVTMQVSEQVRVYEMERRETREEIVRDRMQITQKRFHVPGVYLADRVAAYHETISHVIKYTRENKFYILSAERFKLYSDVKGAVNTKYSEQSLDGTDYLEYLRSQLPHELAARSEVAPKYPINTDVRNTSLMRFVRDMAEYTAVRRVHVSELERRATIVFDEILRYHSFQRE